MIIKDLNAQDQAVKLLQAPEHCITVAPDTRGNHCNILGSQTIKKQKKNLFLSKSF